MGVEIERKFLVNQDAAAQVLPGTRSERLVQGYLAQGALTVRVRIVDESRAWLTLKGPRVGLSQPEFEYEVPLDDARELLAMASLGVVRKRRHYVPHAGQTFEVDVYEGPLEGLITAELELEHEAQEVAWPQWLGRDVSEEPGYLNWTLASKGLPAS